jgi:hypothetical protein
MSDQLVSSKSGWVKSVLWLLTALLLVVLWVPLNPLMPEEGLDASWIWGMNVGLERGLAFGRDLVFTFGPYASVYTRAYHPAVDGLMLRASAYLACSGLVVLWLLFGRRHPIKALCLSSVMLWVSVFPDAALSLYPLLAGLVLLSVLEARHAAPVETDRWHAVLASVLVLMPLGLLPLIKGSLLVMGTLVVACVWAWAVWRRQYLLAGASVMVPTAAGLAFWVYAGQSVGGVADFVLNLFPIIDGYTDAMSLTGLPNEWRRYLLLAAALVFSIAFSRAARPLRWAQASLFLVYLFVAFKAGFVRHDGHAMMALGALLLASTLGFLLSPRITSGLVLGGAIWAWSTVALQQGVLHALEPWRMVASSLDRSWHGAKLRWAGRPGLAETYRDTVAAMARAQRMPRLAGKVDLYPHELSMIFASGNDWSPRPVLQSYSAYTRKLADMNRQHLQGPAAPDHLIFGLQPIDGRYPTLDDGASWPDILGLYQPVAYRQDQMWILDRRPTGDGALRSSLLMGQEAVQLGQWVSVPESEDLVFARMQLKRRLQGALLAAVFKVPPLQITVELVDGVQRSYRLPSGMADAGFMLSPLIENVREFGMIYGHADWLLSKKVLRFRIDETARPRLWRSAYQLELTRWSRPPQIAVLDLLPFSPELSASARRGFDVDASCQGVVDWVNDRPPAPKVRAAGGLLTMSGWLVLPNALNGDQVVLGVQGAGGQMRLFQGKRLNRPDVQALPAFRGAKMTGFEFYLKGIKDTGPHTLRFGLARQSQVRWCAAMDKVIELQP